MRPIFIQFNLKKLLVSLLLIMPFFFVTAVFGQETMDTAITYIVKYRTPPEYKPFAITGRVIGTNLESIKAAQVINICSGQTTNADDNGIFHFQAAKGDTLAFIGSRYPPMTTGVKSPKDKFNIILMKRKADLLPPGHSRSDYEKAKKDDENLYKILDKDAKEEGKWNY